VTLPTWEGDLHHRVRFDETKKLARRELQMYKDERDLLDVLKFELGFLGKGGYQRSLLTPWRAPLIFEDSPTCASYYREQNPHPCGDCLLMQFVPGELREKKIACRYIPLNAEGDTLDSLYHRAYEPEIETAMRGWLVLTIQRLENSVPQDGSPLSGSKSQPHMSEAVICQGQCSEGCITARSRMRGRD
jgi:hypothetical protein